jgi:FKBP-type peptidyl-prolyl cis-trans isomerase FklB
MNELRSGFVLTARTIEKMIEMKLIQNIFVATALLAINASAQPAPPAPPAQTPPTIPPPSTAPKAPASQPGTPQVPPSMMQHQLHPLPSTPPVMPDKDKLSYAIGFNIAGSIKRESFEVDVDTVATAMKDVLGGRPTRLNETEVKQIMTQFQQAMRAKQSAEHEKTLAENKAKGDEYMAQNAKAVGVTTLPNGIQYKVLKEGTGDMPKTNESVTVAYKGHLIDGTVFDQNEHFNTPVTGRTIKGWSAILPMMKTGSKWEITIPPDMAYAARGFPPKIGPNCTLVFEMELLAIAPPSSPPTSAKPGSPPLAQTPITGPVPPSPPGAATPVVSGQIIKVPSAEDLKKGAKIEVITNVPSAQ